MISTSAAAYERWIANGSTLPRWFAWGLPIWAAMICYKDPRAKEVIVDSGREVLVDTANTSLMIMVTRLAIFLFFGWASWGVWKAFNDGILASLPRSYMFCFLGLFGACGLVLLAHPADIYYTLKLSTIASPMALGTVIGSGFFFLGACPPSWFRIRQGFIPTIVIASIFLLYGITRIWGVYRGQAILWLLPPASFLLILSIPIAFHRRELGVWRQGLALMPLVLLILAAVMMQNRLIFVVLIAQGLCYLFLRYRSERLKFTEILAVVLAGVACVAIFTSSELAANSYEALNNRLVEDTRTAQFLDFFERFNWTDFVFGVGYSEMARIYEFSLGHVDIGYVMIAYTAGIPMLICFVGLLVRPTIGAIWLRLSAQDAAVVTGAFGYCVLLLSSANPEFHPVYCIFCLFAGRCAYLRTSQNLVLNSTEIVRR